MAGRNRGATGAAPGKGGFKREIFDALLASCLAIFEAVDLRPHGIEIQNEAVTPGNVDRSLRSAEEVLVAALEALRQDLQAAELRIDDPVVAHSEGRVVRHL